MSSRLLACALVGLAAASLPVRAQQAREPARVGVMPVALPENASRTQRERAERYTRALTEALAKDRPDVVTLGVPGDPAPTPSSRVERREIALIEAARMDAGQVVSAWLRGSGRAERLAVELLDRRGSVLVSVRVRPSRQAGWAERVARKLRPHLAPPKLSAPRSTSDDLVAAQAPSAEDATRPEASPTTSEPPEEEAGVEEGELALEERGDVLPWVLGVGGVGLGLAGATGLVVGGVYGALAWEESNRLVKLPAGDAERGVMEQSSVQKAITADVLSVIGGSLLVAGVASAVGGFVISE